MPDKSSRAEDTSTHSMPPEVAADSTSTDLGDVVLIPLRPASPRKARRTARAHALSPLWSEVASVLARSHVPATPQPVTDEPDKRAA